MAAGEQHGIAPGGYRVLDSLRLEKGYRYFGTDLTAGDDPLRGRPRLLRRLGEGDFNGRAALDGQEPARRLRTLLVGERATTLTVYGGEAIHAERRRRRPGAKRGLRLHGRPQRRPRLPSRRARGGSGGRRRGLRGDRPGRDCAGRALRPRERARPCLVAGVPCGRENRGPDGLGARDLLCRPPAGARGDRRSRGGDRPAGLTRTRDPRARRGRAAYPGRRACRVSQRGPRGRGADEPARRRRRPLVPRLPRRGAATPRAGVDRRSRRAGRRAHAFRRHDGGRPHVLARTKAATWRSTRGRARRRSPSRRRSPAGPSMPSRTRSSASSSARPRRACRRSRL